MIAGLRPLYRFFWDCDPESLSWARHRDFIIFRLLANGDMDAARWLRKKVGDEALRHWFISHSARGLSPQQINYWALILDIDAKLAAPWIETAANSIWEKRR
jgi:hypothetical protein